MLRNAHAKARWRERDSPTNGTRTLTPTHFRPNYHRDPALDNVAPHLILKVETGCNGHSH